VFKGSVKNTPFEKNEHDSQFYHRNPDLNDFYRGFINFERGDEILQIGHASLAGLLRHTLVQTRNSFSKRFLTKSQRIPSQEAV
jgi:hypothetical protein